MLGGVKGSRQLSFSIDIFQRGERYLHGSLPRVNSLGLSKGVILLEDVAWVLEPLHETNSLDLPCSLWTLDTSMCRTPRALRYCPAGAKCRVGGRED